VSAEAAQAAGNRSRKRRNFGRSAPTMNDQVVELSSPGITLLFYSPSVVRDLKKGRDYMRCFPDGKDTVDYLNECRMGIVGVRWPAQQYWLHFSSTLDHSVIARASDHVRLGLEVSDQQIHVRGGDDLVRWEPRCPNDSVISVPNGIYEVTACMVPFDPEVDGPVQIYFHFVKALARPELGYADVPELFCDGSRW
jgi:hypothetical protein